MEGREGRGEEKIEEREGVKGGEKRGKGRGVEERRDEKKSRESKFLLQCMVLMAMNVRMYVTCRSHYLPIAPGAVCFAHCMCYTVPCTYHTHPAASSLV